LEGFGRKRREKEGGNTHAIYYRIYGEKKGKEENIASLTPRERGKKKVGGDLDLIFLVNKRLGRKENETILRLSLRRLIGEEKKREKKWIRGLSPMTIYLSNRGERKRKQVVSTTIIT